MHALIVQYKDKMSTVAFLRLWKTKNYQMKLMSQVETKMSSFTLTTSTILNSYDKEGYLASEHLALVG